MFTNLIHITSIGALISYAEKIEKLSKEEEYRLIKLAQNKDNDAIVKLIESNLSSLSYRIDRCRGYKMPFEDLFQEGIIAILSAIEGFDLTQGMRLITYCKLKIKGAIYDYIKKNIRIVKMPLYREKRKLFYALRSMKKNVDHITEAEIEHIAKKLNVSKKDIVEVDAWISNNDFGLYEDDVLADERMSMEESVDNEDFRKAVLNEVEGLDDQLREIVTRRYLGDTQESLASIGEDLNISAAHVHNKANDAVDLIRSALV